MSHRERPAHIATPLLAAALASLVFACGGEGDESDPMDTGVSDTGNEDTGNEDTGNEDTGNGDVDELDVIDSDAGNGPRLFGANQRFDYQLGGAYEPPDGVTIVTRDREDAPAEGAYNICYINGFQIQPGEIDEWETDLVLRDDNGDPVIDPDWDEALLDISTADRRSRIAEQVGDWIQRCANDGYDAVEIDNLDTYSRSSGRISEDNAVAMMAAFAESAQGVGLAIAQKNSAEILHRRAEMNTDFVMVEECSRYDECEVFVEAYGEYVLMVEYRERDFNAGCASHGSTHAVLLRDLNLVPSTARSYVYDDC